MDFVVGLSRMCSGCDSIWVIIDQLTKSAHFRPVKMTYGAVRLAKFYVGSTVYLHVDRTVYFQYSFPSVD